ncbi:MAG TPA: hypothetical protein VJJ54_00590 [Gemmatimonadales bacterium]|nr:hypothetical protein [Gemmatimonadales bacterium]
MKRTVLSLALVAFLATPLAAQWLGMPAWNSPKGGTGVTFYGDYGSPKDSAGGGDAFGGRAALGVGTIVVTAGIASWKPAGQGARATSYGGTAAFRLIGGSLIPVSVNFELGAGHNARGTSGVDTVPASTTVLGAVGFSVPLPTPGISIEPYFSPGIRYHKLSDVPAGTKDHETNFGWVIGGNFSFGLVGIHLAYDSEKFDDGSTHGVFGLGADVGLRLPMGL